jgi:hypothetical protein
VRSLFLAALVAATVAAGCGITDSSVSPGRPAPSLAPGERPITTIEVVADRGFSRHAINVYDRSLAVEEARSATKDELAGLSPLDFNEVGGYQTVEGQVTLAWQSDGCDGIGDLFVEAGVTQIVISPVNAPCDAEPSTRGVVLTFNPQVNLKRIGFDLVPRETAGR